MIRFPPVAIPGGGSGAKAAVAPVLAQSTAVTAVDNQHILIPPPGYPALDNVRVTQVGRGHSKITRSATDATADLRLMDHALRLRQGPPANWPLPCTRVALVQHLPGR